MKLKADRKLIEKLGVDPDEYERIVASCFHKSRADDGSIVKTYMPQDFYNWIVTERNKSWHQTYFAPKAVKDHQAKNNCKFGMHIIDYMEKHGWLQPGDSILDPMCGIGTYLILAALRGYNSVGVELEDTFFNDMVGYEERSIDLEDGLFSNLPKHIEGSLERFNRLTASVKKVGFAFAIQGDARNLEEIFAANQVKFDVLCSPPYGNRLSDANQKYQGGGEKTFKERDKLSAETKYAQYSEDENNIGNSKIKVICSPPYSRSTEHDDAQIDALPDNIKGAGGKGFKYADPKNIAILDDSEYIREMEKVYRALYEVLESGAVVALVTRDFIQQGKVVQLYAVTVKMMERAGFTFRELQRAWLPAMSFFKRINWTKHHRLKGLPLIDWEDVTFYSKGEFRG